MEVKNNRNQNRRLLNRWVVAGGLFMALVLLIFLLSVIIIIRPKSSVIVQATAIINVIEAPTATHLLPTSTFAISSTEITINSSLPPGVLAKGVYVQVNSTGGDGLRLRSAPGLSSEILMLGNEAEVFLIQDGPEKVDDYTWWLLIGPYDDTRQGWAVSDFLKTVQKP